MDHSSYDPASRPAPTSQEPEDYPLSQTTEIEDASDRAYNTLANYWSIGGYGKDRKPSLHQSTSDS